MRRYFCVQPRFQIHAFRNRFDYKIALLEQFKILVVYAQRGLRQGDKEICYRVTEAVLTYVAVDEHRKPRVVPPG